MVSGITPDPTPRDESGDGIFPGYKTADECVENIGDLLPFMSLLATAMRFQDRRYGPFGTDVGGVRLAVACLEDEVAEVRAAWREERRDDGWPHTCEEAAQVAAVAMRLWIAVRKETPDA